MLSVSTVESCRQFQLVHRMKNLGNRQNKRFTGSRYSLNARMYNGEQRQQTSTKKFRKHFNDCGEAFVFGTIADYYSRVGNSGIRIFPKSRMPKIARDYYRRMQAVPVSFLAFTFWGKILHL